MPRASGQKEYVSLAKGLVTEASPLVFPENATTDELNFVINKDGLVRERRKGFDHITSVKTLAGSNLAIENTHYWQAPDLVLIVVTDTTSTKLLIHRNNATLDLINTVNINSAVTETDIAENTNVIFITTSQGQKPIILEYEEVGNQIKVYEVDLYVRDFELVDDGLAIPERPTTLSQNHQYNLYNAGWYLPRRNQQVAKQPFEDPIDIFFNDTESDTGGLPAETYPSNADIVAIGLSVNENGVTSLRPDEIKAANLGNSEAPRGHYVYNINDFNREFRRTNKLEDGTTSTTITPLATIGL